MPVDYAFTYSSNAYAATSTSIKPSVRRNHPIAATRILVPDKNIARGRFLHPGHHLHTPVDGLDTVCTPFQDSLAPTCTPDTPAGTGRAGPRGQRRGLPPAGRNTKFDGQNSNFCARNLSITGFLPLDETVAGRPGGRAGGDAGGKVGTRPNALPSGWTSLARSDRTPWTPFARLPGHPGHRRARSDGRAIFLSATRTAVGVRNNNNTTGGFHASSCLARHGVRCTFE